MTLEQTKPSCAAVVEPSVVTSQHQSNLSNMRSRYWRTPRMSKEMAKKYEQTIVDGEDAVSN